MSIKLKKVYAKPSRGASKFWFTIVSSWMEELTCTLLWLRLLGIVSWSMTGQ